MTQPARHPASDRLLFQWPSVGVRCGQSMTASLPLPDASTPRIPSQQPSDHPATGSNGAHKRSQIPPHTSQTPHSENRCLPPRPGLRYASGVSEPKRGTDPAGDFAEIWESERRNASYLRVVTGGLLALLLALSTG